MSHWDGKTMCPNIRTLVPNIGKKLGRGMFSIVYEDLNDDTKVYKVTSDRNQRDLYRDFDVPNFLPQYFGEVDQYVLTARGHGKTYPLCILHLEKLYPIRTPSHILNFYNIFWVEALNIMRIKNIPPSLAYQVHMNLMADMLLEGLVPEDIKEGFEGLNGHFVGNYFNCYDFAGRNWMQTKDGEIRCSDPVYNNDLRMQVSL